jgi:hypothetical protein
VGKIRQCKGTSEEKDEMIKQQQRELWDMEKPETDDVTVVVRLRKPHHTSDRVVLKKGKGESVRWLPDKVGIVHDKSAGPHNKDGEDETPDHNFKSSRTDKTFRFDVVLNGNHNNHYVDEVVGQQAVSEVCSGINALVLAYGETGSGKTYTLFGKFLSSKPKDSVDVIDSNKLHEARNSAPPPMSRARSYRESMHVQEVGLATLMFRSLQKGLEERVQTEKNICTYETEVSAVQIYMDHVYDLLSPEHRALRIRKSARKESLAQKGGEICEFVPSATALLCNSAKDFEHMILLRIESQRVQASTHSNDKSSRSHLILTITVKRHTIAQGISEAQHPATSTARDYYSKLQVVDLAGIERESSRTGKPKAADESMEDRKERLEHEARLRLEGIGVNKSLSALCACLRERADEGKADLQSSYSALYRLSTLTRILKEALMSSKIFFLACCSQLSKSFPVAYETLRYADMVKSIKTDAEDNAMLLEQGMIKFLSHSALIQNGEIPRSSQMLTVYLYELRTSIVRVMVSHRWLTPGDKEKQIKGHPDKDNQKYMLLCAMFEKLGKSGWIKNYDQVRIMDWLDYGTHVHVCMYMHVCVCCGLYSEAFNSHSNSIVTHTCSCCLFAFTFITPLLICAACIDQDHPDPASQLTCSLSKVIGVCDFMVTPIYDPDWKDWSVDEEDSSDPYNNYKAEGFIEYLGRGWCRTEMFFSANVPVTEKRTKLFDGELKKFMFEEKCRPHLLFGTREKELNKLPIILPPLRPDQFKDYDPRHGTFHEENDRKLIEQFVAELYEINAELLQVSCETSINVNIPKVDDVMLLRLHVNIMIWCNRSDVLRYSVHDK